MTRFKRNPISIAFAALSLVLAMSAGAALPPMFPFAPHILTLAVSLLSSRSQRGVRCAVP